MSKIKLKFKTSNNENQHPPSTLLRGLTIALYLFGKQAHPLISSFPRYRAPSLPILRFPKKSQSSHKVVPSPNHITNLRCITPSFPTPLCPGPRPILFSISPLMPKTLIRLLQRPILPPNLYSG